MTALPIKQVMEEFAMTDGLDPIFQASSIAVLGLTNTPGTMPHDNFINLLEARYNGTGFPVGPRTRHIAGVRAYDYVLDIPDEVDLAVPFFSGRVCELALQQCIERPGGPLHQLSVEVG